MINKSMGQRGFKRPKNQEYQKQDRGVDKQIVGLRQMRFRSIHHNCFLGLNKICLVQGKRVKANGYSDAHLHRLRVRLLHAFDSSSSTFPEFLAMATGALHFPLPSSKALGGDGFTVSSFSFHQVSNTACCGFRLF